MQDELPNLLSKGKSVAIITFYKHQYYELMKIGEKLGLVRAKNMIDVQTDQVTGRFKHSGFRIVTVDAAQGSEADVVVLSCVRCNRQRNLGFITDKNRLCVALSRAKDQLIVVGSRRTLSVDRVWSCVAREAAVHFPAA